LEKPFMEKASFLFAPFLLSCGIFAEKTSVALRKVSFMFLYWTEEKAAMKMRGRG
jgi:hypothetical protein